MHRIKPKHPILRIIGYTVACIISILLLIWAIFDISQKKFFNSTDSNLHIQTVNYNVTGLKPQQRQSLIQIYHKIQICVIVYEQNKDMQRFNTSLMSIQSQLGKLDGKQFYKDVAYFKQSNNLNDLINNLFSDSPKQTAQVFNKFIFKV